MLRIISVPLFLALAFLLCGTYGALHNQISYSVSPEYFTKLKFDQFQISDHLYNRAGAAIVGWLASWWMGAIICFFLIPAGMLVRSNRGYMLAVLRSFVVVLLVTIATGLSALLVSYLVVQTNPNDELVVRGSAISDVAAFRRAAIMHNFSYLGALLGMVAGIASILRRFLKENAALNLQINAANLSN